MSTPITHSPPGIAPPSALPADLTDSDLHGLSSFRSRFLAECQKVVVGQTEILDGILVAVLSGGHVLLEGVPGTAKTLMVRTASAALGLGFGRIQFTPDLMPSDVTGINVFELKTSQFRLTKGPIFTELLLADEINRAPAKTQSALLEAMQERQVSIDGTSHPLSKNFTVFATQNPVEQEGTYPLPEAQYDRFLLKLDVEYPSLEEELRMLSLHNDEPEKANADRLHEVQPLFATGELAALRSLGSRVRVTPDVQKYMVDLVRATRSSHLVRVGAGPRAALHLLTASRWSAALMGQPFVTPDAVRRVLAPALAHRLSLAPEAELDGLAPKDALTRAASEVPVPR